MPLASLMRMLLLLAILTAAVLIGLLVARIGQLPTFSPLEVVAATPTTTSEAVITICEPDDGPIACLPEALASNQNLADPGNGAAQPAVSKDARPPHQARVVNDGRGGAAWVSNSPDSWIKIDLGQVTTINLVTLEKGNLISSRSDDFGQFVIAVALSDVYADGDSSDDDNEYTPVFHSERADFTGTVSDTALIKILFSSVEARYIKIMFEQEGVPIEEVGIFMVDPSMLVEQPTRTITPTLPGITLTSTSTNEGLAIPTRTSVPDNPPANTPAAPSPTPRNTRQPANTPTPQPTNTEPPADTPTPVPIDTQPPADTATPAPPDPLPTEIPPTAIDPIATLPASSPSFVSNRLIQ